MAIFDFSKKAVLWDLDDTLHSRREAVRRVFPGMFRACLYTDRSEAFIDEAVSYIMTQITGKTMMDADAFRALLARYPSDKPYIRKDCIDYYYAHIRDYAVASGEAVEILEKLKARGVKMAIVTNITEDLLEHQRKKVEKLGIAEFFDVIVLSAEFGVHKPDRRIFDHTAALLGVANEDCLFVGDDPQADISGALSAGMEAVWLDQRGRENCFSDDPRVHRVAALSEYFVL